MKPEALSEVNFTLTCSNEYVLNSRRIFLKFKFLIKTKIHEFLCLNKKVLLVIELASEHVLDKKFMKIHEGSCQLNLEIRRFFSEIG